MNRVAGHSGEKLLVHHGGLHFSPGVTMHVLVVEAHTYGGAKKGISWVNLKQGTWTVGYLVESLLEGKAGRGRD